MFNVPHDRCRALFTAIFAVGVMLVSDTLCLQENRVFGADEEKGKTWSGNWNNRKYKTEGPLTCTAAPKDEKNWEAKFDGKGLGKPFEYKVTFEATKKGDRTLLKGTSKIDGDEYQWTGFIEKNVLQGRYRSASGNNGEFTLKEGKK